MNALSRFVNCCDQGRLGRMVCSLDLNGKTAYVYARTREECEPEEHGGPLPPVLAVVGGEVEPHDEAHRGQGAEQAEVPEEAVDHVEVGAGGGRQHRHGQVHVHGLQVRPHGRLAARREQIREGK